MELLVRGPDGVLTGDLERYIRERVSKLDHYLTRVVDAQMEVRRRHNRSGGDITRVQLTIQTGRNILRAEEDDHEPRRAVDLAIEKMDRQIRRHLERRTDRRRRRIDVPPLLDAAPESVDLEEVEDAPDVAAAPSLVRVKRFSAKPMAPEEAIDRMELLGHDFYLFFNADDETYSVVYRRRDGDYGLLAPERR